MYFVWFKCMWECPAYGGSRLHIVVTVRHMYIYMYNVGTCMQILRENILCTKYSDRAMGEEFQILVT